MTCKVGAPTGTRTPNPVNLATRCASFLLSPRKGHLTCTYGLERVLVMTLLREPILIQTRTATRILAALSAVNTPSLPKWPRAHLADARQAARFAAIRRRLNA